MNVQFRRSMLWQNSLMARAQSFSYVTMSGLDKLMPDVDMLRVFESRLVLQLDRDRVIYCTRSALMYFWEPEGGRVRRIIECALRSMGRNYIDAPVAMDNKGVFNKPRKVRLFKEELNTVLTALRLSGVEVVLNDTELSNWKRSRT
jgi:hypothetical protein